MVGAIQMFRWTPEELEKHQKKYGKKTGTALSSPKENKTVLHQSQELVIPEKLTPRQRTLALGRLKEDEMNKTEAAYNDYLELRYKAGEVVWYGFEKIKIKLAPRTFYTSDFSVLLSNGQFELHEVKGHWEEDARIKIKVAAEQFPFRFIGVKKDGDNWVFEDFSPWYGTLL